jgi:hypothetical protein
MFRVLERNMANVRQSHEKLVVAEFGNMEKERNLLREKKKKQKSLFKEKKMLTRNR